MNKPTVIFILLVIAVVLVINSRNKGDKSMVIKSGSAPFEPMALKPNTTTLPKLPGVNISFATLAQRAREAAGNGSTKDVKISSQTGYPVNSANAKIPGTRITAAQMVERIKNQSGMSGTIS